MSYPHQGITADILKVGGQNSLSSLSKVLLELLPASTSDTESRSQAMKQLASRYRGAENLG